jgi:hypothetical protein
MSRPVALARLVLPAAGAALLLFAAPAQAQHEGHHPAPTKADSAKAHAAHAAHGTPTAVKKDAPHAAGGWKEMDAFHNVMAATWHPAGQKNDLKPLRAQAGALADAARTWAAAPVPKACDTPATRRTIAGLAADSRALADLVAKPASTDAELKTALRALHDRFETVEESCKPAGASHGAHGSH